MSVGTGFGVEGVSIAPMTEDQFKRFLATEIQSAMAYIDSSENISSSRYRNWEYYRGVMADLPTLKGQSSVVSSEVSDYIQMMLPSLLRPFTSGDKLWNYAPSNVEQTEQAQTISRYINEVVFRKDNRGEILLNNWAFDACVQKNGIVKVWWEEARDFKDESYENLTDGEYALKSGQLGPDEEIVGYDRRPAPPGTPIHPMAGQLAQQLGAPPDALPSEHLHDLQIRKTINASRCKIDTLPTEEFIISRDARDYDDAVLKCHRTWEVAGKLIEDGYDQAIVNRLPTYNETRSQLTRPGTAGREQNRQNIGDPSMRKVMVYEGIVRCNYDGAGVRDWYFKAGGQDGGVELLEIEPHDCQIFFCDFCPEPIPHQFIGTCPADRLAQLQKVNTVLIRQALQNIYLTNAPQREVVADNILSPDQLSNFAPGASIMVKAIGSVNAIPLSFSAEYAFKAIEYFDSKAADRVGVSRQSAGLDPDALQNQSATAANLAWNASMGRVEMITKIWANTGLRRLGEGLLKIIIARQDFQRAVILDGKPVQINPADWQGMSDMEVTVSTGLGTGHRDRDNAFLQQVLGMQREWIQQFGPTEVVGFDNLAMTCQKITECGGITAPEAYFATVPKGWTPKMPPPQPPPQVIAAQTKAQTDLKTTAMREQTKQADIQTKSALKLREQDIQAAIDVLMALITHHKNSGELKTAYEGTGP